MANPVVYFDIGCRDLEGTERFYSEVFGWSFEDYAGQSRRLAGGGEGGPDGALTALGHEPHQYVMVYVAVDDVAATLDNVKEQGGEVLVGPLPTPGGETFAWIKDPGGNMIGLLSKE